MDGMRGRSRFSSSLSSLGFGLAGSGREPGEGSGEPSVPGLSEGLENDEAVLDGLDGAVLRLGVLLPAWTRADGQVNDLGRRHDTATDATPFLDDIASACVDSFFRVNSV
jgi:hypothetical protein